MQSVIGITVAAPPDRFFELVRDVTRWPVLLPHYRRVTVAASRGGRVVAQMVAVRTAGIVRVPVTWRAVQWAEADDPGDLRLRFRHIRGVTRGMDVTWHVRPHPTGAQVTIEHDFRRPLPIVGEDLLPAVIDRFFTRAIAGRTLATFKELAEAGAPSAARTGTPA